MDTPYWVEVAASVVYLLPVLVAVLALVARGRPPRELALWIPGVVAVDSLSCLLGARLVPFDLSLIASRVAWLGAAAFVVWSARRRWRPSPEWTLKTVLVVLTAGMISVALSASLSRDYPLWDRDLHIPSVPLLRAQRIPFGHVFQAHTVFHYHFLGDAIAAALQTFSGARLHAALTLSLAHDLVFGLIGSCVAAWLCSLAPRKLWIVPAVLAVFLIGPLSLLRPAPEPQYVGFSGFSFWGLSYRPHVAPSALFLIGLLACVVQRATDRPTHPRLNSLALVACTWALGITDEASVGTFSLALGATWLFFPEVLSPSRLRGLALLGSMAAGIVATNVALAASIAPGGPVQTIRVTAFRLPGWGGEILPLFSPAGLRHALLDFAPLAALFAAIAGWAIPQRHRPHTALLTLLALHVLFSSLALFVLNVNHGASESHRFITASQVILSVVGLLVLAQTTAGQWPRGLILAAFFASAASSFYWAMNSLGPNAEQSSRRLDCRRATGAHLLDRAAPAYVPAGWFTIAGCRPLFTPGTSGWQTLQTSGPAAGRAAFERLDKEFVSASEPLPVACLLGTTDPVCAFATGKQDCRSAGTEFRMCALTAPQRQEVLTTVLKP
jgi:hypothetical protein